MGVATLVQEFTQGLSGEEGAGSNTVHMELPHLQPSPESSLKGTKQASAGHTHQWRQEHQVGGWGRYARLQGVEAGGR